MTSSSESSIITLRFFIAGSEILLFVPAFISLNEYGLYPPCLSLSNQKWHCHSLRSLHPLQLTPLLRDGELISTSSCSLAAFAGGLYPAGVEKNFLHKSVTVHKTSNTPNQKQNQIKSRKALQWMKSKEKALPQSCLFPRSFRYRRSHNCSMSWQGKRDNPTDGETERYCAIPRKKQIDSPSRFGGEEVSRR